MSWNFIILNLKKVYEFCYFFKYINQLAGKGELTLNRRPVSDSNCENYNNYFLGQLGQVNNPWKDSEMIFQRRISKLPKKENTITKIKG